MAPRPGLRRSKSCFHVSKENQDMEIRSTRKRSKSSACDVANLRRFRVVKIDDEVAHLIEENQASGTRLRRSRTSRALRRVKTFLRPFRRKYECAGTERDSDGLGWAWNYSATIYPFSDNFIFQTILSGLRRGAGAAVCHSWQRGIGQRPLLTQTSPSAILTNIAILHLLHDTLYWRLHPPPPHSSKQLECSLWTRLIAGPDQVLSRRYYGLFSVICPQICVSILRKLQDTLGPRAVTFVVTRSGNNKCHTVDV